MANHQLRLLMEIKSLEGKMQCPASETRSSAPVPVECGPSSVAQSSMKKPKMLVQSTLAGYAFLRDAEDPSYLVPLPGPKTIDAMSTWPSCSWCGNIFKALEGKVEHERFCKSAPEVEPRQKNDRRKNRAGSRVRARGVESSSSSSSSSSLSSENDDDQDSDSFDVDQLADRRLLTVETADEAERATGLAQPPNGFIIAPRPIRMPSAASLVGKYVLWVIPVIQMKEMLAGFKVK